MKRGINTLANTWKKKSTVLLPPVLTNQYHDDKSILKIYVGVRTSSADIWVDLPNSDVNVNDINGITNLIMCAEKGKQFLIDSLNYKMIKSMK